VALIGGLVAKVGTDIATNIENRIIDAAVDVVSQKQQPQLSVLGLYMSDLQKGQDEIKALQIREVKKHYQNGIDFLGYANKATDKIQKEQFIHTAIECFTSASNVEEGEAKVNATVFVGACFYALRRIDSKTTVTLENGAYDKAFRLAEQSLGLDRKPSRDLIKQLLRLPYLQGKHGTFEVYWKKWEPPKLIEPPKVVEALPGFVPSRWRSFSFSRSRTCVNCGKDFDVQPKQFPTTLYCPECSPHQRLLPQAKRYPFRRTCSWCHKEFDAPSGRFPTPFYCPECKSKYHL
jgi:DNA-directed RNA polymerase subunit RPC12/RpoP